MAAPDQTTRGQRTTALTCALMAEVTMGTAVLIWHGSPAIADATVFGRTGSIAVVTVVMVLTAASLIADALAGRLGRPAIITTTLCAALAVIGAGIAALETLTTDPGVGLLHCMGCALLTLPVGQATTRSRRSKDRAQDHRVADHGE